MGTNQIFKIQYITQVKSLIKGTIYIIFFSLMFSCAKTELVSELDFQKNLLAGTGAYQNTKHVWRIDSATLNGAVVIRNGVPTISPNSTKFILVTFTSDGSYSDDDYIGSWTLPTIKELRLNLKHRISGNLSPRKYEVVDLNAARLHLKFDSTGFKQDLYYNIYN